MMSDNNELWNGLLKSDSLDLSSDVPDLEDLPDDVDTLKDMTRKWCHAILKRNVALHNAKERLDSLSTSHDDLLRRSAQWKDELESTKFNAVAELEQQLNLQKAENEGLQDRLKDLRFRAEESRRAIMRLQGERKSVSGPGDRRSVTAASLVGWNPSVLSGSSEADNHCSISESSDDKRAKRSTILFGSAAGANASGGRVSKHMRTSSNGSRPAASPRYGSTAGGEAFSDPELTPRNRSSGGLRGLRLSSSEQDECIASESLSSLWKSTTAGGLAPPAFGSSRPLSTYSQSPMPSAISGHSGLGSSMMEERFFATHLGVYPGTDDEPVTARPPSSQLSNGFGAMQLVLQKEDELARMQTEMKVMRARLDEAIEARSASDACLKALKEFIGEGGPEGGEEARAELRGVKLPPLPTDCDVGEDEEDELNATLKSGSGETWTTRWASLVRKSPLAAAPQTPSSGAAAVMPKVEKKAASSGKAGGNVTGSEVLSTSPSVSSTLSGPSYSVASTDPSAMAASQGSSPGLAVGGGLASFSSFFARTQSSGCTPTAPSPAKERLGATQSVAATAASLPERVTESSVVAGPALNRLGMWFKKSPAASEAGRTLPPTGQGGLPVSAIASPPFASLEHSTLQKVSLDSTQSAGFFGTGTDAVGGLGQLSVEKGSGVGEGVAEVGAPVPPPHKGIQPSARAAHVSQRTASVGEEGGLLEEGGPFVAPTFD